MKEENIKMIMKAMIKAFDIYSSKMGVLWQLYSMEMKKS